MHTVGTIISKVPILPKLLILIILLRHDAYSRYEHIQSSFLMDITNALIASHKNTNRNNMRPRVGGGVWEVVARSNPWRPAPLSLRRCSLTYLFHFCLFRIIWLWPAGQETLESCAPELIQLSGSLFASNFPRFCGCPCWPISGPNFSLSEAESNKIIVRRALYLL